MRKWSFLFATLTAASLLLGSSSLVDAEFRPILITLDQNDDFVITGDGQDIGGIEFTGPKGTFELAAGAGARPGDDNELVGAAPAPFQFLLSNYSHNVTIAALGGAIVDGSFPLKFGPHNVDMLDDILIRVGDGNGQPVENPFNLVCDDCAFPNVALTADGGIEVSNINEPIINLTIMSEGGIEITEVPFGATILDSSATSITFENPDGFTTESLKELGIMSGVGVFSAMSVPSSMSVMASVSSVEPVYAQFTLASNLSFGPFEVMSTPVPVPEPTSACLISIGLLGMLLFRRTRG